jgi:hypothetical protein
MPQKATKIILLLAALLSISAGPRTSPLFDHYYTRIGIKAENERLKYYGLQLKHCPNCRGLIMVYAADEKSQKSAKARAQRAYEFVVKNYGIEPGRVVWRYEAACKNEQILLYLFFPDQSVPDRDPKCMRAG